VIGPAQYGRGLAFVSFGHRADGSVDPCATRAVAHGFGPKLGANAVSRVRALVNTSKPINMSRIPLTSEITFTSLITVHRPILSVGLRWVMRSSSGYNPTSLIRNGRAAYVSNI
jgi:hypothetical protein